MEFDDKVEKQEFITALDDTYHQIEAQIEVIRQEAVREGLTTPLHMKYADGHYVLPELLSAKAQALDALVWLKYEDEGEAEETSGVQFLGASAAALAEQQGRLNKGDMQLGPTGDILMWTGSRWATIELSPNPKFDFSVITKGLEDALGANDTWHDTWKILKGLLDMVQDPSENSTGAKDDVSDEILPLHFIRLKSERRVCETSDWEPEWVRFDPTHPGRICQLCRDITERWQG